MLTGLYVTLGSLIRGLREASEGVAVSVLSDRNVRGERYAPLGSTTLARATKMWYAGPIEAHLACLWVI